MTKEPKRGLSNAVFTVRNVPDCLDHRETSDQYRDEILRKGRFRVILCRDGIKWIVQRAGRAPGAPWRGLHYCTTRKALSRLWEASTGETAPEIARLPETVRGVRAMDEAKKRPTPRDIQARRIRWKFGLSEPRARLMAELAFGGPRQ